MTTEPIADLVASSGAASDAEPGPIDALRRGLPEYASVPKPGTGATAERWRVLSHLGAGDLSTARLVEGHLDALAILSELGHPGLGAEVAYGVWAAQPAGISATRVADGWHLRGRKGWCSGSTLLDGALVTATAADGPRLFLLDPSTAVPLAGSWQPIGMAATLSHTIDVDTVVPEDRAIGGPGAYVQRPGFWHGGMGVAAVWLGGARAVLAPVRDEASPAGSAMHAAEFGAAAARLDAASALLDVCARRVDASPTDVRGAREWAVGLRLAVEQAARHALDVAATSLGAGAVCAPTAHARRFVDLQVYLRQLDIRAAALEYASLRGPSFGRE